MFVIELCVCNPSLWFVFLFSFCFAFLLHSLHSTSQQTETRKVHKSVLSVTSIDKVESWKLPPEATPAPQSMEIETKKSQAKGEEEMEVSPTTVAATPTKKGKKKARVKSTTSPTTLEGLTDLQGKRKRDK
jgi:hypothetical protein